MQYTIAKIIYKLKGNDKEVISKFFRKQGMHIGKGCNITCNISTPEPWLIHIGDNVAIAGSVAFITHDNSIMKIDKKTINLFGRIRIGNNCFIGRRATIMYGVTLADNIIVAAGSLVTNSFSQSNIIIGGVPARVIGTWEEFYKRNAPFAMGKREGRQRALAGDDSKFIIKKDLCAKQDETACNNACK